MLYVPVLPWTCPSWILCPAQISWLRSLLANVWWYCPEVPKSSPQNWTNGNRKRVKLAWWSKQKQFLLSHALSNHRLVVAHVNNGNGPWKSLGAVVPPVIFHSLDSSKNYLEIKNCNLYSWVFIESDRPWWWLENAHYFCHPRHSRPAK